MEVPVNYVTYSRESRRGERMLIQPAKVLNCRTMSQDPEFGPRSLIMTTVILKDVAYNSMYRLLSPPLLLL